VVAQLQATAIGTVDQTTNQKKSQKSYESSQSPKQQKEVKVTKFIKS
jgi:hypothetical protein